MKEENQSPQARTTETSIGETWLLELDLNNWLFFNFLISSLQNSKFCLFKINCIFDCISLH